MFFYDGPVIQHKASVSVKTASSLHQRQRVGKALDAAMAARGMTNRALAQILEAVDPDVNEEKVSTFRRGRVLLPDYLAQVVAMELGMKDDDSTEEVLLHFGYDPMVMVRLYGFFPSPGAGDAVARRLETWSAEPSNADLVSRLREVERLDLDIGEREHHLVDLERDQGAASLVRVIMESSKYAVAVWPVFAGPADHPGSRVHVSDRLDIRRLDARPVTDRGVWKDLGHALTRARALPSTALPRWSGAGTDPLAFPDPHLSMWNIRRLDAPRRPRLHHSHSGFPAVAISATVSNTWVGYLASMVAFALGYGLTSTTDLARHLHGAHTFNPSTEQRNLVHDDLLRDPGDCRVWYHAAKVDEANPNSPWAPRDHPAAQRVLHVRLVEEDQLLASTAADRLRQPGFLRTDPDALAGWRRSRDAALATMPQDEWHLRLTVPDAEWGSDKKWGITLGLAVEVLEHMTSMGLTPWEGLRAAQTAHAQLDPTVAGPMLQWMAECRAPFVAEIQQASIRQF